MYGEHTREPQTTLPASAEEFYATSEWGLKSGQTPEEFSLMWEWASANHGNRKARNMAHAISVMASANRHADNYELANPDDAPVNRKIMNGIAISHDIAGLDEEAAAEMFAEAGSIFGYDDNEIAQVCSGIRSTDELAQPSTREEMLVTMGDMDNLADPDYENVKQRGQQFEDEARDAEGENFEWVAYHRRNLGRVVNYIMKNISLGGYERDWLNRVHSTARRMIADFASERGLPVFSCAKEIGDAAIKLFRSEKPLKQEESDS